MIGSRKSVVEIFPQLIMQALHGCDEIGVLFTFRNESCYCSEVAYFEEYVLPVAWL